MLGPPGAGKGTQAERISRTRQLPKISTGDILREAVTNRTPLGCAAREAMEAGRLVSDDVMIGIVQERLERADARKGFVLDGFPRTIVQAEALDRLFTSRGPLSCGIVVRRRSGRRLRRCGSLRLLVHVGWSGYRRRQVRRQVDRALDDECASCASGWGLSADQAACRTTGRPRSADQGNLPPDVVPRDEAALAIRERGVPLILQSPTDREYARRHALVS